MSRKKTSRKNTSRKNTKQTLNPTLLWGGLGILLVIVVGAFLFKPGNTATADTLPLEISVSEAASMRDAGAFVLDVREPSEWNEYHLPGATLIPLGELASRVNEVPKDQEIVVMCNSGNRSQAGRDILLDAGFTHVTSMKGGIQGWMSAGLETISGP